MIPDRVLISRYIEAEVLPARLGEAQKRQRYADWLENARLLAQVTFYDPEIERTVRRPAGGGCCGSSCSAGR
ncbi:MAG: hypothetical protein QNI89_02545 [Desulfobacterales bacterium]|nr:hypothetical protein [Desulfobacterales bacterium]MDJ0886147.1 hypothetical protein [Desulfobacterales bacterium]